jgi:magnesium transporter
LVRRIEQLSKYGLSVTTDWINYAFIDDVIDGFLPILKFVEFEVDSIEELVLVARENEKTDMLQRIGRVRKHVNALMRLISTKSDMIKSVISRCLEELAPDGETRLYLEVYFINIRIYRIM